jgi:hypothetical protein
VFWLFFYRIHHVDGDDIHRLNDLILYWLLRRPRELAALHRRPALWKLREAIHIGLSFQNFVPARRQLAVQVLTGKLGEGGHTLRVLRVDPVLGHLCLHLTPEIVRVWTVVEDSVRGERFIGRHIGMDGLRCLVNLDERIFLVGAGVGASFLSFFFVLSGWHFVGLAWESQVLVQLASTEGGFVWGLWFARD